MWIYQLAVCWIAAFSVSTRRKNKKISVILRAKWDDNFEALKQYYQQNGHCDVGTTVSWNASTTLSSFVQNQRKEYKKWQKGENSHIDERKIDMLDSIEFIWDKNRLVWENRFKELLAFKKEFGHLNVPMKYKTLGQWVTKHRKTKKSGMLSKEKMDRLDEIGFIWDVKEWQFQRGLRKMKDFKARHGHLKIKITDGEFGSWFYTRRKEYLQYLNGEKTTLSEQHRLELENIGFGPHLAARRKLNEEEKMDMLRRSASWEKRYDELVEFHKEFNHTRVPKLPQYAQLSTWVTRQRTLQASGKLAHDRFLLLERIGFVWNTNHWRWMKRFSELQEYLSQNGNTNVPKGSGDLGEWVDWQRVQWSHYEKGKKSQINAQRVALLNSIDFDWNRGETRRIEWDLSWYKNLNKLKKWKAKHGNCNVSRKSDPALGLWVSQQRMNYKKLLLHGQKASSFTDERMTELEKLGLFENKVDSQEKH